MKFCFWALLFVWQGLPLVAKAADEVVSAGAPSPTYLRCQSYLLKPGDSNFVSVSRVEEGQNGYPSYGKASANEMAAVKALLNAYLSSDTNFKALEHLVVRFIAEDVLAQHVKVINDLGEPAEYLEILPDFKRSNIFNREAARLLQNSVFRTKQFPDGIRLVIPVTDFSMGSFHEEFGVIEINAFSFAIPGYAESVLIHEVEHAEKTVAHLNDNVDPHAVNITVSGSEIPELAGTGYANGTWFQEVLAYTAEADFFESRMGTMLPEHLGRIRSNGLKHAKAWLNLTTEVLPVIEDAINAPVEYEFLKNYKLHDSGIVFRITPPAANHPSARRRAHGAFDVFYPAGDGQYRRRQFNVPVGSATGSTPRELLNCFLQKLQLARDIADIATRW